MLVKDEPPEQPVDARQQRHPVVVGVTAVIVNRVVYPKGFVYGTVVHPFRTAIQRQNVGDGATVIHARHINGVFFLVDSRSNGLGRQSGHYIKPVFPGFDGGGGSRLAPGQHNFPETVINAQGQ